MNKVWMDDLPRRKKIIDWRNCGGSCVKFKYYNIEGVIKIIDVNVELNKVLVEYEDKVIWMSISSFREGKLGLLFGVQNKEYIYEIGMIYNDLEIINHTRNKHGHKAYVVRCIKDGYTYKSSESNLKKNKGCAVCCNQKVMKGINDVSTTHPEIVKYFVNLNEAYSSTAGSTKKFEFMCPDCGTKRWMSLYHLANDGFSCKKCGDGISYPNKFIFNVLTQLKVDFVAEKCFSWSDNKIYDMYIKSMNIIIEAHGMQHYNGGFEWYGGRSLIEEQENDRVKLENALNNGIKRYIVLDCRHSNVDWIKHSVMNSDLPNLLGFKEEDIDWIECDRYGTSSRLRWVCAMWDGTQTTTEISLATGINRSIILKYLKKGSKLGLCNYSAEEERAKAINKTKKGICVFKDGVLLGEYDSINFVGKNAMSLFGVEMNATGIIRVCKNEVSTYKGFTFKYIN